jgi:hypothetical protein
MRKFRVFITKDIYSFSKDITAKNQKQAIFRTRQAYRQDNNEKADWEMRAVELRC